ncbi:DUF6401 family natural product biosynthesis protein [Actinoplanes sp. NPDC024001]
MPEPGAAPATTAGWLAADWSQLRLVAVCLLALDAGLL